jgi:hypothetical protein
LKQLGSWQICKYLGVLGCLLKLSLPEGGLYKPAQIAHSNIHRQSSIESIHPICLLQISSQKIMFASKNAQFFAFAFALVLLSMALVDQASAQNKITGECK